MLASQGKVDDAVTAYRRAIMLNPNNAHAHANLSVALKDLGRLDESIAAYRRAIAAAPNDAHIHSNLLYTLHFHSAYDAAAAVKEHAQWNQKHAEPMRQFIQTNANDRDPARRLKLGYVSADLRHHSVANFLEPILAHHDHQQLEIFCYSDVRQADHVTARLAAHADMWRESVGLSDAKLTDQIRADRIDILVDLSGHTGDNRLLTFARKPAPVQVTYLGYPDTTGLRAMDFRLTDAFADPPGESDEHSSERLIRLSPSAWCYQQRLKPLLDPRQKGSITFGCFNNFAKVTEPMLTLWARILQVVPGSRLMLKAAALDSAAVRQKIYGLMARMKIGSEQLHLRGLELEYVGHLRLYGQIDIALDTFPYHGTTTTCEALWMGVPVISLVGSSHVSRVGVSLLSNVGLSELLAHTPEEYVAKAKNLANDLPRLHDLNSTLRRRMERSPLMEAAGFTRNIEAAYRQMWRSWCETNSAGN